MLVLFLNRFRHRLFVYLFQVKGPIFEGVNLDFKGLILSDIMPMNLMTGQEFICSVA